MSIWSEHTLLPWLSYWIPMGTRNLGLWLRTPSFLSMETTSKSQLWLPILMAAVVTMNQDFFLCFGRQRNVDICRRNRVSDELTKLTAWISQWNVMKLRSIQEVPMLRSVLQHCRLHLSSLHFRNMYICVAQILKLWFNNIPLALQHIKQAKWRIACINHNQRLQFLTVNLHSVLRLFSSRSRKKSQIKYMTMNTYLLSNTNIHL